MFCGELDLENKKDYHIKNFVTGKFFPPARSQQIVDCQTSSDKIYDQMIKRLLQPDNTVEMFAPVKQL